jgi:hypothetical protein
MDTPNPPTSLTPIDADQAIVLARRWRLLALVFNLALCLCVMAAFYYGYRSDYGLILFAGIGLGWIVMVHRSVESRRLVLDAPGLIAAGEYAQAEDRLGRSMRMFSIVHSTKTIGLQQLAILRHAQSRFAESALLCREILANRRTRADRDLSISTRLLLAESLAELQDPSLSAEIAQLSAHKLNLREMLAFTHLRLDEQSMRQDWKAMLGDLPTTLGLIELLPPALSSRCHALLALACLYQNDAARADLLKRRATLLGDPQKLAESRPALATLFGR